MKKVLNLYSGIGGNRKLWTDVQVTAVEINQQIADIYHDFFPDDRVIVGDAHQYLLDHYKEYDFIWSSPPCPTHSDIRRCGVHRGQYEAKYPDMSLYQEVILLNNFGRALFCIENVKPYYQPLINAQELDRHLFWSNFYINKRDFKKGQKINMIDGTYPGTVYGFNIDQKDCENRRQILRNMVNPELGLHIYNAAMRQEQMTMGYE